MKLLRYSIVPLFLGAMMLVVTGCQDLTVENKNAPDRERALANASDLVSLLEGGHDDVFYEIVDVWATHMDAFSDQMTTTNNVLNWWDFTEQPRMRLNNRQTYSTTGAINGPWSGFNAGVSTANSLLQTIEQGDQSIVIEGNDRTQELRAAAYFLRGVARGYIGMIYDKGYVVGLDTDVSNLETSSYSEVIDAAISDLETAKQVANEVGGGFTFNSLPNNDSFNLTQFTEIANTFAARFLLNEARTMAEAEQWPDSRWNEILNYAENAVGQGASMSSFTASSVSGYTFSMLWAWYESVNLGDGSGYNPPDIKIQHLLDPDYPADYPSENGVVLDPAESEDPRIQYNKYVGSNFGFLNPSRNRNLFTSYSPHRMRAGGANWGQSGFPVVFATGSEMQYIIAEANLWLGNKAAAATALENSPFGDVPTDLRIDLPSEQAGIVDGYGEAEGFAAGKEISASASRAEFIRALHTEYSVELKLLGGMGLQWYFMRRFDLLQEGSPLHYPIPGQELQLTGRDYYTFGGAGHAGEEGTASGDNSWKTYDERHGIEGPVGVPSKRGGEAKLYKAPVLLDGFDSDPPSAGPAPIKRQ